MRSILAAAAMAVVAIAMSAGAASTPDCFGAAARDPLRPCSNPALRLTVRPKPSEALLQPNAPCSIVEHRGSVSACAFGVSRPDQAARHVALVGDSHAMNWRAPLTEVAYARHWRALSITQSGCPLTQATTVDITDPVRDKACQVWKRDVLDWFAHHPEVSVVFVSQNSNARVRIPRGRSAMATKVAGFRNLWNALPGSVQHVVVLRDAPRFPTRTQACVERAMARRRPPGPACAVPRRRALPRDPAAVAAVRLRSPRVQVANLTSFMCGPGTCPPVVGGALVLKDTNHLSLTFATSLAPFLLRRISALSAGWR